MPVPGFLVACEGAVVVRGAVWVGVWGWGCGQVSAAQVGRERRRWQVRGVWCVVWNILRGQGDVPEPSDQKMLSPAQTALLQPFVPRSVAMLGCLGARCGGPTGNATGTASTSTVRPCPPACHPTVQWRGRGAGGEKTHEGRGGWGWAGVGVKRMEKMKK